MKNYLDILKQHANDISKKGEAFATLVKEHEQEGYFKPEFMEDSQLHVFSFGERAEYTFAHLSKDEREGAVSAYSLLSDLSFAAFTRSYALLVYGEDDKGKSTLPVEVLKRLEKLKEIYTQYLYDLTMGDLSHHLPSVESVQQMRALSETADPDPAPVSMEGVYCAEVMVFVPNDLDWDQFQGYVHAFRWEHRGADNPLLYRHILRTSTVV